MHLEIPFNGLSATLMKKRENPHMDRVLQTFDEELNVSDGCNFSALKCPACLNFATSVCQAFANDLSGWGLLTPPTEADLPILTESRVFPSVSGCLLRIPRS